MICKHGNDYENGDCDLCGLYEEGIKHGIAAERARLLPVLKELVRSVDLTAYEDLDVSAAMAAARAAVGEV